MTVLLALAAWSPTVKRPLVVELPAIVVNEPPPRPVRLIYQSLPVNQRVGEPHLQNVWYGARDVLLPHLPYQPALLPEQGGAGVESGAAPSSPR